MGGPIRGDRLGEGSRSGGYSRRRTDWDGPQPRNTPPGIKLEYDVGRSPGSQVVIAGPAFPAVSASGMQGVRLAVYSCGGSPGIGEIEFAAPDSLFIPASEYRQENLIVTVIILTPAR